MAIGRFGTLALLKYNGYDLSANETVETTSYLVTPVYDADRRTVKWCEFADALRWYVGDTSTTSPHVQDMVARLTKAGMELSYTGRGTGFESPVNRGTVKDVDFGPRPGSVSVTPMGGDNAVKVEWSVTFCIPSCPDGVYRGGAEWGFTVASSFDADRVETRTTSGHLTIANNRVRPGDPRAADTADAYLEDVLPGLIVGFQRTGQSHQTSEDKSSLTYSVTDVEMGGFAPPPHCTTAEGEEGVASDGANMRSHVHSIRCTYTLKPGRSVDLAWFAFFRLVKDRRMRSLAAAPGTGLVPVSFSATNPSLFGPRQKVTMAIAFRVIGPDLSEALSSTGVWWPIPNSDRRQWMTSIDSLFDRGQANLVLDVGKSDRIVDLCKKASIPQPSSAAPPAQQTDLSGIPADVFPDPTADNSWLLYQVSIKTVVDTGRVVLKTLPEEPLKEAELRAGGGASGKSDADAEASWIGPGTQAIWAAKSVIAGASKFPRLAKEKGGTLAGDFGKDDTIIQQRVTPTVYVNIRGRVLRYGFDIPHPAVSSIDGCPAHRIDRGEPDEGFVSGPVGQSIYPVFGARFNLWFCVPGLTKAVTPGPVIDGR